MMSSKDGRFTAINIGEALREAAMNDLKAHLKEEFEDSNCHHCGDKNPGAAHKENGKWVPCCPHHRLPH